MKEHNVPDWYIESCYKIKYMFPKAHAAAYMIATLRLGWYKVHYPVEYYAAYFTVRSEDFDGATAVQGRAAVQRRMRELEQKQKEHQSTVKEDAAYSTFQIINEMLCRGIELLPVDLYKSDAKKFLVEDGKIRLRSRPCPVWARRRRTACMKRARAARSSSLSTKCSPAPRFPALLSTF